MTMFFLPSLQTTKEIVTQKQYVIKKKCVFIFCIMVVIFWHLEPKGSNSKQRRTIKGLGDDTEYGLFKFIGIISPDNDAKLIYYY